MPSGDRLGPRLEVEQALDRRHLIGPVSEDPHGLRHRVHRPAAPAADLHVLSNGAGFRGVVEGDLVVSRPVDLDLPGHLSAARPTEAVSGLPPEAIVPGGRSAAVQGHGGVALDRHRRRRDSGSAKGDDDGKQSEKGCSPSNSHGRFFPPYDLLLGCHSAYGPFGV